MLINFKVVEPKFRKVKVFNLNWLIFEDVTFVSIFLARYLQMQLLCVSYFRCFNFFIKYFSIYLFPISQQASNVEHFHFRCFWVLQLLFGLLFFFCHTKLSKTPKKKTATLNTAQNTVTSPDSLVWKFCGNLQFPQSFEPFAQNPTESLLFHKTFRPGN